MILDENKKIPFDVHYTHHSWIEDKREQERIDKENEKKEKERKQANKDKFAISIISSIAVAILLSVGATIIEWYKKGGN